MDEALVQHAEHDVDRHHRGEDQPRLAGERLGEFGGVAGIAADHRRRHADRRACAAVIGGTASLSEAPGARLKLIVTDGNCSWCAITSGAVVCSKRRERGERHLRAAGSRNVELAPATTGSCW